MLERIREMPYGEIVDGLAAQERRSNSQTTLSQFNASSSQPQRSARSTDNNSRDSRPKPTDRRSNKGDPTDTRSRRPNRDDEKPRRNDQRSANRSERQSAKTCVNHPGSHTHSTHECNSANPKGICYDFIRGNCDRQPFQARPPTNHSKRHS